MRKQTVVAISLVAAVAFVLSACGSGKSSSNASNTAGPAQTGAPMSSENATVPNCGATQAVWVNLNTKVYHEPSDPAYGKTKHGEYLCPSQAVAQGFHAAGGGRHTRHHKEATAPE
jgi:hypothetical protein